MTKQENPTVSQQCAAVMWPQLQVFVTELILSLCEQVSDRMKRNIQQRETDSYLTADRSSFNFIQLHMQIRTAVASRCFML